jgi:hypothetical protein
MSPTMRSVRKAVITLITVGVLLLSGSAAFSASYSQSGCLLPPIGTITIPGLICTNPTTPPKSATTAPPTTAPSTSATTAAAATKTAAPPAVVKPTTTPSASQLAGASGRSGLPTTGALIDPAAPVLAVPQIQDALSAPQLAAAQAPANNTQVLAAGPTGGNVLAAGQSSLLSSSTHPLLRVLLALVAIAIAALAASQLPAARRLMRATDQ